MRRITHGKSKFLAICIAAVMLVTVFLPVAPVFAEDGVQEAAQNEPGTEGVDGEPVEEENMEEEADTGKPENGGPPDPAEPGQGNDTAETEPKEGDGAAEQSVIPGESAINGEAMPEMSLLNNINLLSAGAVLSAAEIQQEIDALGPGGSVDLVLADDSADFLIDTPLTVPAGVQVTLDINGRTVRQQKAVGVAGSLSLKNSRPAGMIVRDAGYTASLLTVTGSLVTNDIVLDGGAVWTGSENAYLKRGTVNSGIAASASLVTISNSSATFQMNGGTVLQNNVAAAGGGVSVSAGTFTMEGGSITHCADNGNNNGGAVYMTGGSFVLNGGKLTANSALRGGAVSAGGVFTMNGGEIKNNATFSSIKNPTNAGGVLVPSGGSFTLNKGEISDNYAKDAGGGVSISDGRFTMNGGTISGNKGTNGGGVNTAKSPGNAALFLMKGGKIANNSANYGGGVQNNSVYSAGYTHDGTTYYAGFILLGGDIDGNTAVYQGGGVHADTVYAASQVALLGGTVSGNKTTSTFTGGGGGLYLERGTSGPNIVRGVEVTGNTAGNAGGGLYLEYSENQLEDLTVSGNTAKNGGGIYIVGNASKPAKAALEDSIVTDNTATNSGGGVYLNKSGSTGKAEFIMEGDSKLYGNRAAVSGSDYTAVAGCVTTLRLAADMNLPGRDNWFEDKSGTRYIDAQSPVVYPVVSGDTSALDLTLGIVHTVTYKDGLGEAAFADEVHGNLPHNSDTPGYSAGTPAHEGHTFTGWDLAIEPKVTQDATYTAQWEKNKHTVTYNDGVDGEEIFPDDIHTDIPYADPTPAFVSGTPVREGHTFIGWTPEVAPTVTRDVIYRAGWEKDSDPAPTPTPSPNPHSTPDPAPVPPADIDSGNGGTGAGGQAAASSVKTGDGADMMLYVLIAIVCGAVITGLRIYSLKKRG